MRTIQVADILASNINLKPGGDMIKDKKIGSMEVTQGAPIVDIPGVTFKAFGTADKFSTGLKQKQANFPAFTELIRHQFDHGGDKYATKLEEKEFTDLICEAFPGESGVDWVLGTCMKYMGRYKNFRREKDLLKVATYMYLLWLKGGFHMNAAHDEDTARDGRGAPIWIT